MSATITQYLNNIVVNAEEICHSRDATEDIADAAAAIIADVADLRNEYDIRVLETKLEERQEWQESQIPHACDPKGQSGDQEKLGVP